METAVANINRKAKADYNWQETALGRPCRARLIEPDTGAIFDLGKILITGAGGSIGRALVERLLDHPFEVLATDIEDLDVAAAGADMLIRAFAPDTILHLAGAKHAPAGEENPLRASRVHVEGTESVLRAARELGAVVVTASTCKACMPETAYGASKLIAERLTLNAGQRVARFHNVVHSDGNVFEIWRSVEGQYSIEVSKDSMRYGITLEEAVALTLRAATSEPGRYVADPGAPASPSQWAMRLYPRRSVLMMDRRRGDRAIEPLHADCERAVAVEGTYSRVWRVVSEHD